MACKICFVLVACLALAEASDKSYYAQQQQQIEQHFGTSFPEDFLDYLFEILCGAEESGESGSGKENNGEFNQMNYGMLYICCRIFTINT